MHELAPVLWTPGLCGQGLLDRKCFELSWADVAQGRMKTNRVVDAFDVYLAILGGFRPTVQALLLIAS